MRNILWGMAITILLCHLLTGCKGKEGKVKAVCGVLEHKMEGGVAPQPVRELLSSPFIDDRFECIYSDSISQVSVWSLLRCSDTLSAEGYGVVVVKGNTKTAFPDIRHGNMPKAWYDAQGNLLHMTGVDMEGTGVSVERLYTLRFDGEGHATIASSIDPYDMQQAFRDVLGYTISGEQITLYAGGKPLAIVMNHEKDMGGFMDDAIWIGEQLTYKVDSVLTVCVVPGVNFVVGKVLHYEDMPTIAAPLSFGNGGFTLGEMRKTDDDNLN